MLTGKPLALSSPLNRDQIHSLILPSLRVSAAGDFDVMRELIIINRLFYNDQRDVRKHLQLLLDYAEKATDFLEAARIFYVLFHDQDMAALCLKKAQKLSHDESYSLETCSLGWKHMLMNHENSKLCLEAPKRHRTRGRCFLVDK